MSKLERLNFRVEKLLSKAVQEVLKVVQETVSEYQEKTARTQRENQSLKRRLQELQESTRLESNGIVAQTSLAAKQSDAEMNLVEQEENGKQEELIKLISFDGDSAAMCPSYSFEDPDCEASTQSLPNSCLSPCLITGQIKGDNLSEPKTLTTEIENGLSASMYTVCTAAVIYSEEDHTIKEEPTLEECTMLTENESHAEAARTATSLYTLIREPPQASSGLVSDTGIIFSANRNGIEESLTQAYRDTDNETTGKHYTTQNNSKVQGSSSRTFQRNVRKHYCCLLCGRTFRHAGDYKKHSRVHTGEKPYCCSVCGKRFSQSGYLKVHLRYHTGEKPFICSYCGRSFSHSSNMKKHQQTHL